MPQLPRTRCYEYDNLGKTIPYRPGIGGLAQIPEVLLALSLVLLFSPDVLKLLIEVANLIGQFRYMRSVGFYVSLCRADNDVEVETDMCVTKPRSVIRRETDGVVACFDRCECEFSFQRAYGLYDNMARGFFLFVASHLSDNRLGRQRKWRT
jgi:hypothetical protein